MFTRTFLLVIAFATTQVPVRAEGKQLDFAHDVAPLLIKKCGACHIGAKRQGGFSMNSRESFLRGGESGASVVVGKSGESELLDRITTDDKILQMPPEGPRLTQKEVAILRDWIDGGLEWDPDVAFEDPGYQPPLHPRDVPLPPVVNGMEHPIDRLANAYFLKEKIPFPQPIDDATFLRRVSLDLVGVLPTPEELTSFLSDANPKKRDALVDRLLSDDIRYTEHWLTFWNDLLRNDYSGTGFITGGRKQVTGWLYDSLKTNKPYDQFVRELMNPTPASEGFLRGIQWRGEVSASQITEMQFAQSLSQTFMGINIKCASCHDSFINSWKLDDAWSLAAIASDRTLEIHRCDKPLGKNATPGWLFPELGEIDPGANRQARLKQLSELMTHPQNGRLTRTVVNRLWHRLLGRGIVHPVDAMDRKPFDADLLDWLAVNLSSEGYNLKQTLRLICTSRVYQSAIQPVTEEVETFRGPISKRMSAEQYMDAIWALTRTTPVGIHAPVTRDKTLPARAALRKSDLLMRSLGRPNRDQIVTMRPETLTTLEAITLFNNPALVTLLKSGGEKILKDSSGTPEEIARHIYMQAWTREPTPVEMDAAREILSDAPEPQNVEDLVWSVIITPEFQLIR